MTSMALDPIRCTGHRMCAELLPERIGLDEWGYPVLARGDLPEELVQQAQEAAATCPTRALRLTAPAG